MSKVTPHEQAMTDNTSWSPNYIAPSDVPIQVWRDGALQPLEEQEPAKPMQRVACTCVSCSSGRGRAYAQYAFYIDALIAVLNHGDEQEKQQLKQLLGIVEQEGI